MKALILRNDAYEGVATARALLDKGFQILSVNTLDVAHALIRIDLIDTLVIDERLEGQLTHALGLSGERKNPYLSTILLSDRPSAETDDLFELIPSLYAVVGTETSPELLSELAVASVIDVEATTARVAKYHADDLADAGSSLPSEDAHTADTTLVLAQSDLAPAEDVGEDQASDYADVAIAGPAMAEISALDDQVMAKVAEDLVQIPEAICETAMSEPDVPDDMLLLQQKVPVGKTHAISALAPLPEFGAQLPLERVEEVVMAEVAALCRNYPLAQMMKADHLGVAKVT